LLCVPEEGSAFSASELNPPYSQLSRPFSFVLLSFTELLAIVMGTDPTPNSLTMNLLTIRIHNHFLLFLFLPFGLDILSDHFVLVKPLSDVFFFNENGTPGPFC